MHNVTAFYTSISATKTTMSRQNIVEIQWNKKYLTTYIYKLNNYRWSVVVNIVNTAADTENAAERFVGQTESSHFSDFTADTWSGFKPAENRSHILVYNCSKPCAYCLQSNNGEVVRAVHTLCLVAFKLKENKMSFYYKQFDTKV